MTTVTSYLYDNNITVQLLDEDSDLKTRERIVYSRTVKVYKQVDNVITVQFRNSDQKAANIAGKAFTFSISSDDVGTVIWSDDINITNVTTSVGSVLLDRAMAANLTQEYYNYRVSYTFGNLILPGYTDDNWGFGGQLQVISTVL